MSTIEMPKTYHQLLDEIEVGYSMAIPKEKRNSWQSFITKLSGPKVFKIKTIRETGEIRIWRLEDKPSEAESE